MDAAQIILQHINERDEELSTIAKQIWDNPQVALQETYAARLLADTLAAAGFDISWGAGGMSTAFIAEWGGGGSPTIGFLGEYDALPGLSQELSSTKSPIESGGPGHGCGHNLYGTACLGAVLALQKAMQSLAIPGTIRFYGCPAEETLVGKTFMARDGVFDDLDAALTWHPGASNVVWNGSSLAMNSFRVNFYGVAAHAGGLPWLGRSALDGVMLMDAGVNYMREHVPPESRIHSVVTRGGDAPNVVPAYAQVWYFARAPKRAQVEEIYRWMQDIAQGAALMTGTRCEIEFLTGCYDLLPNQVISDLLYEKMAAVDDMRFTEKERDYARELQASFPPGSVQRGFDWMQQSTSQTLGKAAMADPLWEGVFHHSPTPPLLGGSTEVADVSWITPTAQMITTCWPLGTPAHSWQAVASTGSSIGAKGMLFAAKTMALAGCELLVDADLLAAAKAEFLAARGDSPYVTPLPPEASPK
ncbi:MAG: amidohydrolase [Chloroflexi bacterium]|nr:amidohydrolase [Chloroflexota bacterium]MCY4247644.1 amidohydrolase [Chloroflexota bacterium]